MCLIFFYNGSTQAHTIARTHAQAVEAIREAGKHAFKDEEFLHAQAKKLFINPDVTISDPLELVPKFTFYK